MSPSVPLKGNLSDSADQENLDNCILPALLEQSGEGPLLFQYDCAPVHKPRSINTWLGEFGVEELDRPAQSPRLNPIQQHWNDLEERLGVRPSHSTSVSDLRNAPLAGWAKTYPPLFPQSQSIILVKAFPEEWKLL